VPDDAGQKGKIKEAGHRVGLGRRTDACQAFGQERPDGLARNTPDFDQKLI
jgi:hypothetical protein